MHYWKQEKIVKKHKIEENKIKRISDKEYIYFLITRNNNCVVEKNILKFTKIYNILVTTNS